MKMIRMILGSTTQTVVRDGCEYIYLGMEDPATGDDSLRFYARENADGELIELVAKLTIDNKWLWNEPCVVTDPARAWALAQMALDFRIGCVARDANAEGWTRATEDARQASERFRDFVDRNFVFVGIPPQ